MKPIVSIEESTQQMAGERIHSRILPHYLGSWRINRHLYHLPTPVVTSSHRRMNERSLDGRDYTHGVMPISPQVMVVANDKALFSTHLYCTQLHPRQRLLVQRRANY